MDKTLFESFKFKPVVWPVEIEGGPTAYVKELSGRELDRFDELRAGFKEGNSRCVVNALLHLSICSQDGRRLFADEEWESLSDYPSKFLMTLFKKAFELNFGKTPDDESTQSLDSA